MSGSSEATPALSASANVEVPFHDVDVLNVCWHGHDRSTVASRLIQFDRKCLHGAYTDSRKEIARPR